MPRPDRKPICSQCGEKVLFEVNEVWNDKLDRYELVACGSELCNGCLGYDLAEWVDCDAHFRYDTPSNRYYLKHKGGDPRNHNWREVGEEEYNNASDDQFIKKVTESEVSDAESS